MYTILHGPTNFYLKKHSIKIERLFINNLRSREIMAQVMGHKKPLYEGHLLDRDIHIADLEIPEDSLWCGKTLSELRLRNRFGVHISSILRGVQRINIPNGSFILFPGDKIQAIGSDEQLMTLTSAIKEEMYEKDAEIEKREMRLHQIIINSNSSLVGKSIMQSGIRDKYNCMIVGIEEGKENLSQVDPQRVIQAGDIIWIVGEREDIDRIDRKD